MSGKLTTRRKIQKWCYQNKGYFMGSHFRVYKVGYKYVYYTIFDKKRREFRIPLEEFYAEFIGEKLSCCKNK